MCATHNDSWAIYLNEGGCAKYNWHMVNVQRSYVNVQKAYQMFGVYLDIFFIIMNRDWRNDKGFFIIKSFRLNKMFIYDIISPRNHYL